MTGATPQTVVLFTNRPQFERDWASALDAAGLDPRAASPSALPSVATKGAALVIDAGAESYDDDELLAHVGLARALGAVPVVALPADRDVGGDEIFDDLCEGLVTRRSEDVGRVVASLARRADASRARRFEFLTVSPRGGELLAIFSDGSAVLVDRDVLDEDDGTQVEEIALEDDAMRAVLKLESGGQFELTTSDVARKSLLGGSGSHGEIDGVRLGQRIRELRLAAGLTQAELARRTGIHRPNIARVEAGRHTPSLETLSRLANAIGVPTTRVLD
ncbi:MAG: helix-turn-helix domain-containing protein [Sandaracinaceae bacterium]